MHEVLIDRRHGVAVRGRLDGVELRVGRGMDGVHPLQLVFAIVGFCGGCIVMYFVVWGILSPVWDNDKITGDKVYDQEAVQLLTLVWWVYPVVSVVSRIMLWGVPGYEYSANASWVKDMMYATLDVTSKGGLALYVALRTTWLPVPAESVAAELVTAARVDAPGVRVLENAALLGAKDERPVG